MNTKFIVSFILATLSASGQCNLEQSVADDLSDPLSPKCRATDNLIDHHLENLGNGRPLPETENDIKLYCQDVLSQHAQNNTNSDIGKGLDFIGQLNPAMKAIALEIIVNSPMNLAPYHLSEFCRLNISKSVDVAKAFNSRLCVAKLIKDSAIAKIVKASNDDSRTSLHRIICAAKSYVKQQVIAHSDNEDMKRMVTDMTTHVTLLTNKVERAIIGIRSDQGCGVRDEKACVHNHFKSLMYPLLIALNKQF